MAKAPSLVSKRQIENVCIIHSEEDLEPVVRRLAHGFEENLKLPGQADYERGAANSSDTIIDQLKRVNDSKCQTVLYISDDLLKLFKKKKKQVESLKGLLQKNSEDSLVGKNIVTLWGELKDKDLVKKVLGVDFSKLQKSHHICDLKLANFSLNEVGNIVEAVLKLWLGPEAELPKATHDTGPETESLGMGLCSQDPSICEAGEETCKSTQDTAVHVSVIHFDQKELPFVSRVAFHLMKLMKLEKSVDFFTFYDKDDMQMIRASLVQLNKLENPNEKAVVIMNRHLLDLFKSNSETLTKFESLCKTALEQSNNLVFLLKNVYIDEVKECWESLAPVISSKYHIYDDKLEDKDHIETAVFRLTRFLRDGAATENDESTMVYPMKEEYADPKRKVVGNTGDTISTRLLSPSSDTLPVTANKDQTMHSAKSKDVPDHIVTSSGDSLHMRALEDKFSSMDINLDINLDINPNASNEYGGQSKRTTDSLQQCTTPNVYDSDQTTSKLEFSGYYQQHQHQIQSSHSETLFSHSECSSSKTVQEQPSQNGFSPVRSENMPSISTTQVKPSLPMEKNTDAPLVLRSRVTTDSSNQVSQQQQQLAANKTDGHTDFQRGPNFPQKPTDPPLYHERKSEPTNTSQYPGEAPKLPQNSQQVHTNPMPQHPVSQQPVQLFHYVTQSTMPMQANHLFAQPRTQQPHVTGQGPYVTHAPHNHSTPWQHQSQRSAALTADDFTRLMSDPEFHNHLQRYYSLQTQPTGVPAQQPASAQRGEPPRRPALHSSRSTPEMAASNFAVPRSGQNEIYLVNLNTEVKHKIALKLNSTKLTGYYWKHFAEEIGVTQDEIRYWESIQCNYMDKLFDWLATKNEEYTITEFKGVATRFERADILKILSQAGY